MQLNQVCYRTLHLPEPWTLCMAACGGAPMCQIDDKDYVENLTPEKIDKMIEKLSV